MPEKLKKLVAAYEELEQKLGDPAVIADPKEYARLAVPMNNCKKNGICPKNSDKFQ